MLMMVRSAPVLLLMLRHVTFMTLFPSIGAIVPDEIYKVPSFELSNLEHQLDDLSTVLVTTGLFAVDVSDTDFERVREVALDGLCQCDDMLSVDGTDTASLSDGLTTRTTLATATMGNKPLPLPQGLEQACGIDTAEAMEALRDHVALVSKAFITALDHILPSHSTLLRNSHGGTYSSIKSIVKASSNLEHFHLYSKQPRDTIDSHDGSEDDVLEMHTDAGLFLAFVPGLACNHNDQGSSFFVNKDGKARKAIFPQGSIAIMLGAGAEHWLNTPEHVPLRATRHAVKMRLGDARAWYGTMHLVPQSAIVQDVPQRTFADMREAMVMSSKKMRRFGNDPQANVDVSIGCGNSPDFGSSPMNLEDHRQKRSRARLQHVADASVCNNVTNFFCWMSCLDIPDYSKAQGYINEGYSLYCVDPSVLASSGNRVSKAVEPCNEAGEIGTAMNSNCMGSWQPTAPGVPAQEVKVGGSGQDTEEPFCYGGTSMYMEGFQWIGTTCIIYLFPQWVLSTAGSLASACIGTLFFGAALEWVIRRRRTMVESMPPGWKQVGVSTIMYGIQLTMGYFLMLVVMTYSGPLFLCVVVGLMGGHLVFNLRDAMTKAKNLDHSDTKTPSSIHDSQSDDSNTPFQNEPGGGGACCGQQAGSSKALTVPEGSTPCCQHTL